MSFTGSIFTIGLASVLGGAMAFSGGPAAADCTTTGIHLNEIRFLEGETPLSGTLHPTLELYNRSGSVADLTGWGVRDLDANLLASLPSVSLPHGAFLVVVFGSGSNEFDFTDGLGTFYTNGASANIFDPAEDAAALYSAAPSSATIEDFVQWSLSGVAPGGVARTHAMSAGIWTVTDHVKLDAGQSLFSIRLLPDGYDTNRGSDWDDAGWGESRYGTLLAGPNALQIAPADETGLAPGPVSFEWTAVDSAKSYHLEVSTDSTFAVVNVADATSSSTDTTLTLGDGTYFWRVRIDDSCGPVAASVTWRFSVFTESSIPTVSNRLGVVRQMQHKDSKLLCVWNDRTRTRPGCHDTADEQGPWDDAHASNHAAQLVTIGGVQKEIHCQHCAYYCMRACVSMINHHYGGDLSQDRVSVQAMTVERAAGRVVASPEGDLGHQWPALLTTVAPVLQWALGGSTVSGPTPISFTDVRSDIDAGMPMIGLIVGTSVSHVVVIDGYAEPGAFGPGVPSKASYRVRDPWPGAGNVNGWVSATKSGIAQVWRISGAGLAGRAQEATVGADGDGDGVPDFDEGAPDYPASRPRAFHSDPISPDRDRDDLRDKPEIHGYTFYTCGNNDALGFPDVDGDGLRAEGDCDSDDGALFDGGEDIHGLGVCNGTRDPFNAADDGISVHTDKPLYFVIDDVKLAGSTFHADTTYPFANIPLCPDLIDGQGIGAGGALSTNASGAIPFQTVAGCTSPKLVLTVVDVLRDNVYQEPDCQNPLTCWVCLGPIYRNDLSVMDRHDELVVVKYHPMSVAFQVTPDFMHTGTGFHAELNGPGNPQNPINVGVRLPPFQADPGDQVFLTYWTAFFSQGMNGVVRVSTNGGGNWTPVTMYDPRLNGFQGVDVIDITPVIFPPVAVANQPQAATSTPVLVEFLATGPPASGGWFLDDFGIGRIPASTVDVPGDEPVAPIRFALAQNQPNPFSFSTMIAFEVPRDAGMVNLSVFDVGGRRVRVLAEGPLSPGRHLRIWDGRGESGGSAAPGLYFLRMTGNGWSATKRMTRVMR